MPGHRQSRLIQYYEMGQSYIIQLLATLTSVLCVVRVARGDRSFPICLLHCPPRGAGIRSGSFRGLKIIASNTGMTAYRP